MIVYISILRGINVSGQKIIKMADLKLLYEAFGFTDVTTYIQSGNVIFKSNIIETEKLVAKIEKAIHEKYNFKIPSQVLNVEDIKAVFDNNPFIAKKIDDISKLHVTFLSEVPDLGLLDKINKDSNTSDEFILKGKTIYLHCPNGYGRTKLTNNYFESKLKINATTRNWKTIGKLVELTNLNK